MNTLKNVLFFGLLLAVLCGVYLSLNRPPEPTLPPGLDTNRRRSRLGEQIKVPLIANSSGQQSAVSNLAAPAADLQLRPVAAAWPRPFPQPSPNVASPNVAPPFAVRRRLRSNSVPPPPPTPAGAAERLPVGCPKAVRSRKSLGRHRDPTHHRLPWHRRPPTIRRRPRSNKPCSRSSWRSRRIDSTTPW